MTAIRRFLPSGALLTAEIVVADRVTVWLDAILDRYPESPEPTPLGKGLLRHPVVQGIDSYLLTRWADTAGGSRMILRKVGARAEPGPHLEAHEAKVFEAMRRWPPDPSAVRRS